MNKRLLLLITTIAMTNSLSVFAIDKITVNGLFQDKAIVTIDGKQRILKKGKASPEGALLIEADSQQAIIKINGKQQTYTLGTQFGSNTPQKPSAGKKVSIPPDASGGYSITGAINGSSVPFIVDTGATLVSMNSNIAKRLGIDYKLEGKQSISYTASGTSKIYIVNLKRVRVGDIELSNVKGAVHEGNFPVITLLGMSFLGKLDMKSEGRMMELEKKY